MKTVLPSAAPSTSSTAVTAFPSTSTSTTISAPDRPTVDPATAKASFQQALSYLPVDTQYVQYIDWDALGHPGDDFMSVVDDGMTDRWTNIGIPAHSEQWSAGFLSAHGAGEVLHWRDTGLIGRLVAAMKSYQWHASGPASATHLTYSFTNKRAAAFAFMGEEVWADTTSGTLIVEAHGDDLLSPATSSRLASATRYRPMFDALPQFAAASLYLGSAAACNQFPRLQPPPPQEYIDRYLATVARFHVVESTAALMAAATIPERAHIGVTQHIDSDVFVQLADPAAAQADLQGRASIGASKMLNFGTDPTYFMVTQKDTVGPLDHYRVTGPEPVEFHDSSSIGYNVCGKAK